MPGPQLPTTPIHSHTHLTASPNPVPAPGPARGHTTITWHAPGFKHVRLYVSVNNGQHPQGMANGGVTGRATATWIIRGDRYRFSLYTVGDSPKLLATVNVTRPKS